MLFQQLDTSSQIFMMPKLLSYFFKKKLEINSPTKPVQCMKRFKHVKSFGMNVEKFSQKRGTRAHVTHQNNRPVKIPLETGHFRLRLVLGFVRYWNEITARKEIDWNLVSSVYSAIPFFAISKLRRRNFFGSSWGTNWRLWMFQVIFIFSVGREFSRFHNICIST